MKENGDAEVNDLSDAEVDIILERFDQTDPKLQRRIIAQLVIQAKQLKDEIKRLKGGA
jgi:hypothetical protein